MKVEIKIFLDYTGDYFYVIFMNTLGRFYYTESGKRNYMDYGGFKEKNQIQIRRLGKWWEKIR
jgi:hypothetical protein